MQCTYLSLKGTRVVHLSCLWSCEVLALARWELWQWTRWNNLQERVGAYKTNRSTNIHVTGLWVFKNWILLLGNEIRPIVDSKGSAAWPICGGVDAFITCFEEFNLPDCAGSGLPSVDSIDCDVCWTMSGWDTRMIFSDFTSFESCIHQHSLWAKLLWTYDATLQRATVRVACCFFLNLLLQKERRRNEIYRR